MTHRGSSPVGQGMSHAGWWGPRQCLFSRPTGASCHRTDQWQQRVAWVWEALLISPRSVLCRTVCPVRRGDEKKRMWLLRQSTEQRVWKINPQKEEGDITMFSMFISLKMAKHSENYAEFLGDKKKLNNAGTEYEIEWKEEGVISLSVRRITLDLLLLSIIMLICQYKCILSSSLRFHVIVTEV